MQFEIEYYSPAVMDEITALPLTLRARYFHLVDRMETHGPDLGMPHTRAMGGGLLEMRLKGREGIARVLYCISYRFCKTANMFGVFETIFIYIGSNSVNEIRITSFRMELCKKCFCSKI